ncbi:hypothetical protein QTO30_20045 [Yoonia sp. GPGPB17]|uniref:hypothetical protein n=1 Tax=Yoonia sp. GPGPB17 TaxID=3026147 RepID=UPI0030BF9275
MPAPLKKKPKFIIVAGRTFSGKTTISKGLQAQGYRYLSVSDTMKAMSPEKLTERENLGEYGKSLMDANDGEELYLELLGKMMAGAPVVLDGLRPLKLAERFKNELGDDLLIILCTARPDQETSRFNEIKAQKNETMSIAKIRALDKRFQVDDIADLPYVRLVSGTKPVESTIEEISQMWS